MRDEITYLAGPMTGIPQFNVPAFEAAAADLRVRGLRVVSPIELDDVAQFARLLASPDGKPTPEVYGGETWGDFLARDVKVISDLAASGPASITVLPGWWRSRGARLEVFVGRLHQCEVYRYTPALHARRVRLSHEDVANGLLGRAPFGARRAADPVVSNFNRKQVA